MLGKTSLAIAAALLIGAVGPAQAGEHKEKGGNMSKYDANGDGMISLEEARKAGPSGLAENFEKYDENGNQKLDEGEFARFEADHGKEMKEKAGEKKKEMMGD
jgi:Ca2+-binding EF-hand superfamily protein